MHGERVDGNDVAAVYRAVEQRGRRAARAGDGPTLPRGAHLSAQGPLAHGSGHVPAREESWKRGWTATRSCSAERALLAAGVGQDELDRVRAAAENDVAEALERALALVGARRKRAL